MTREDMIERVYAKTELDFDQIEALSDEQLRELLGLNAEPVKPKKPPRIESPQIKPLMIGYDFTEHEGALYRLETWRTGDAEQQFRVRCANTVKFEGRSVSASIVLHWLRTGELVRRVPRERKTWQAAIRENGKVKHIGRFTTKEQRDAAVLMYRLNKTIDPMG
jgi:hypothetical protein